MKLTRRILSTLLSLALLVCCSPLVVKAQEEQDVSTTFCDPCIGGGSFDAGATFQGEPCGEQLALFGQEPNGTELCSLYRLAGAAFCGCGGAAIDDGSAPELNTCYLCGDPTRNGAASVTPDKGLPDLRTNTCRDMLELPAVDGDTTCSLLQDKYAHFCGCPSTQPTCNLCSDDSSVEPNVDLPWPFGDPDDPAGQQYSCFQLDQLFQITTAAGCPLLRDNLVEQKLGIDVFSYCQCSNFEPPNLCGDTFCPTGTSIPDDIKDDPFFASDENGNSCGFTELVWRINTDPTVCSDLSGGALLCCAAPGQPALVENLDLEEDEFEVPVFNDTQVPTSETTVTGTTTVFTDEGEYLLTIAPTTTAMDDGATADEGNFMPPEIMDDPTTNATTTASNTTNGPTTGAPTTEEVTPGMTNPVGTNATMEMNGTVVEDDATAVNSSVVETDAPTEEPQDEVATATTNNAASRATSLQVRPFLALAAAGALLALA